MNLTREQWLRVEALFARLLQLPPEERRERLRQATDEDPAVRAEAAGMLAAADTGGDFLSEPVQVSSTEAQPDSVGAGTRYGPWRILGLLGRGGMGEVYRAERADGAYQQQVALKILKRGLDTDALLLRFLRERRILAQLTHPNIAHLIDAGATPEGRPYLVMEQVEGLPIDDWCRQQRAPLRLILELMCEVCDAVHVAHRRLVVHRDLKPSNVLVTQSGKPKLLDFGIAKLLDEPDTDTTATGPGSTPVTLQYAAPEQILGEPVTTASDVYALGALLYQLLTGRLPRDHYSFAAAAVAVSRGEAAVTRPSAALQQAAAPAREPAALRPRELEGELDLIVLHCLNADPERRYRSASELADDLRHFLAQRPIVARPDSFAYRTGRFVRRNRIAVAAASAVFTVLVCGISAVAWQTHRAEVQALRAEHVKDLVLSVFRQQDPLSVDGRSARTPAQLVAVSLGRADRELRDEPDLHAELLDNLGEIQFNMGDNSGAIETLRRALREKETYYGRDSREVAATLAGLMQPLEVLVRTDELRGVAGRGLGILHRLGLDDSVDAARIKLHLGIALSWGNGAPEQALALQTEAIRIFEARLGPDHPETIHAVWELGVTEEQGRHDAHAETLLRSVIARYETLYGRDSAWLERPLGTLAIVLERNERPQEAEALLLRAIAIAVPLLGPRHGTLANVYRSLGVLYGEKLGRFAEAEQAFRSGLAAVPPDDDSSRIDLLKESGRVHLRMRQWPQAESELGEAFSQSRKVLGEDKGITWYTGSEWGRALAGQGRLAEAEAIQRQAAARLAALIGPDTYQNCLIDEALADTLEQKGGSTMELLVLRRRALTLTEGKYPRSSPLWAERAYDLSRALLAQDGAAAQTEARSLLDQAATAYRLKSTPMDPAGQVLLLRAELETRSGERDTARTDLEAALQKFGNQAMPDAAAMSRAQALQRELGRA